MEDIDWKSIDKTKFFVHGLGLFSGVTTMLFPLSVIKTRQMASHGVSGGFQGSKETAKMVWRSEGIPGFYRGFATVVFGTIPARTIYLTSLEITKSTMHRLGKQLQLSDTTTAGVSNFVAGACASLSTQLVTVPIDVVSQRQMVYDTSIKSAAMAAARAGSGASNPGAVQGLVNAEGSSHPTAARSSHASLQASHAPGEAGASNACSSSSSSCSAVSRGAHAAPCGDNCSGSSSHRSALHVAAPQHGNSSSSSSSSGSGSHHERAPGSSATGTNKDPSSTRQFSTGACCSSNSQHPSSSSSSRSSSTHTPQLSSSNTWRFSSASEGSKLMSSSSNAVPGNRGGWASSCNGGGGTSGQGSGSALGAGRWLREGRQFSNGGATCTAQAGVPSGFQVVRHILKQEGPLGLYRGFGMSLATFVPSSAIWWSAYGVYQQLIARAYIPFRASEPGSSSNLGPQAPSDANNSSSGTTNNGRPSLSGQLGALGVTSPAAVQKPGPQGFSSFSSASSSGSGTPRTQAADQHKAQQHQQHQHLQWLLQKGGSMLSTGEVMVIQTGSSMLAGATSSLLTNPLDLIKTRIQVAHRHEGQPTTIRAVITEIVAEDGSLGLFRGVLPRMANAALWGTCMVTVYEFLRRVSKKDPEQ